MDITSIIKNTLADEGKVWIFSDPHLLERGKDTPRITCNERTLDVFQGYINAVNPEKDMVIFLGDFVDDTIPMDLTVSMFVKTFNRLVETDRKIWVRGNNDMISDQVLKNDRWSVCYAATAKIDDKIIVFSHTSIDVSDYNAYNVHGHMHRNDGSTMYYYHPCVRCINIAPVCHKGYVYYLDEVMDSITGKVWSTSQWFEGEEKPGMSKFIYEQATVEFDNEYHKGGNPQISVQAFNTGDYVFGVN